MDPNRLIEVPLLGNRLAVAIAFEIHIAIVALVIGIAMIAPVAEWAGHRGDARWARLAHGLGTTVVKIFAFGATWAVFALVFLFAVYPRLVGVLMGLYFWMALVVAAIWVVMTLSAYTYAESWERLATRRPVLHMAFGWLFVVSTMAFITLISGVASFQLAPTSAARFPGTILTATWIPQALHRHVGNLSYGGLVVAGYAGLRLLFSPGAPGDERAWHDWLGHVAVRWGLAFALLQPVVGTWYALRIRGAAPGAFHRLMQGELGGVFLLQIFLFGAAFFCANLYVALAARGAAAAPPRAWRVASLVALGLLVVLGVVPRTWPGGDMAWKYVALAGIVLVSAANLVVHRRARRGDAWGRIGAGPATALVAAAVLTVALLLTMGYLRSGARGRWLVYERLPEAAGQQYERGTGP